MSDSGQMNECCGHSTGHAINCDTCNLYTAESTCSGCGFRLIEGEHDCPAYDAVKEEIMNEKDELKPCPFCGSKAESDSAGITKCYDPSCGTWQPTVDAWNTRASRSSSPAMCQHRKGKMINFNEETFEGTWRCRLCGAPFSSKAACVLFEDAKLGDVCF